MEDTNEIGDEETAIPGPRLAQLVEEIGEITDILYPEMPFRDGEQIYDDDEIDQDHLNIGTKALISDPELKKYIAIRAGGRNRESFPDRRKPPNYQGRIIPEDVIQGNILSKLNALIQKVEKGKVTDAYAKRKMAALISKYCKSACITPKEFLEHIEHESGVNHQKSSEATKPRAVARLEKKPKKADEKGKVQKKKKRKGKKQRIRLPKELSRGHAERDFDECYDKFLLKVLAQTILGGPMAITGRQELCTRIVDELQECSQRNDLGQLFSIIKGWGKRGAVFTYEQVAQLGQILDEMRIVHTQGIIRNRIKDLVEELLVGKNSLAAADKICLRTPEDSYGVDDVIMKLRALGSEAHKKRKTVADIVTDQKVLQILCKWRPAGYFTIRQVRSIREKLREGGKIDQMIQAINTVITQIIP